MATCSQGHVTEEGAAFCDTCGEDFGARCAAGHPSAPEDAYCGVCGSPVTAGAASGTALVERPVSPAAPPPSTAPVAPTAPVTPPAPAAPAAPAPVVAPAPVAAPPPPPVPASRPLRDHQMSSAPVSPGTPASGFPPFHFSLKRLTALEQVTMIASGVLVIALFLPWFGVSYGNSSASINGLNDHEYLAFAMLTALGLVVYLTARAGWDRMPFRLPVAHAPLLLLLGTVQLLIVLIAFLFKPHGFGHSFGSWLALVAAIAACLPVAIPAVRSMQTTTPHG